MARKEGKRSDVPAVKKHWRPVTDPVEVAALKLAGKWKVGIPLWRNIDGIVWAECGDFKLWRDARVQEGKRSGTC